MPSMIRQHDVFRNPLRAARDAKPFVVNVQHHLIDRLGTRIVAPLVPWRAVADQPRLYPAIRLVGQCILYFDPTDLMTVPLRLLRDPVANLEADRDRIVAALDLVFTGI